MHVRARLFAMQRQIAGTRQLDLEVGDGGRMEAAWEALVATCPPLASGREYVRFARNGKWAEPDELLADGDEVAFIPPVSGGSGEAEGEVEGEAGGTADAGADGRIRDLRISEDPIDDAVLRKLEAAVLTPFDGAVVLFVGRTRATPGTPAPGQEVEASRHEGADVLALEYEAYESMALDAFREIAAEVEDRFAVRRIAIVHRVGVVALGEASVAVAAASPHRDAAFEACRYAIDELKARAPIWKSERFADGSVWIGEPARVGPREEPKASA